MRALVLLGVVVVWIVAWKLSGDSWFWLGVVGVVSSIAVALKAWDAQREWNRQDDHRAAGTSTSERVLKETLCAMNTCTQLCRTALRGEPRLCS